MAYLLGIDIGTSGTKTALFDYEGNTIASSLFEYPLYQPQNGWAEQNPIDWWNAVCNGIQLAIKKAAINPDSIKGVGLSGQMHGLVMLDKNHHILCPSIIWCDQRTENECLEMTRKVGKERLSEITANPALTGFTASKILWICNHKPDIYEKCDKILLPKDYIRFMLTGEFATEVSDASGTQLLDVPARKWSDEILNKLQIEKSKLCRVFESYEISGSITKEAAVQTGLPTGTPVCGGAGDQAAGAIGNGIVRQGDFSCSLGTSGVVFAYTDKPVIDKAGRVQTFCHAIPNAWHVMGVTQAAGLSLKWFRDNFCIAEKETAELMGVDPYFLMDKEAEQVPAGSNRLIYLPYLMGERTPHLDSNARGVFFGLSALHAKRDMLRSVLEGVAFSQKDSYEIIKELGIKAQQIRLSGGGCKSPLWRQILCDILNCNVAYNNSSEGPAFGAALLAGTGVGIYKSVIEACDATITIRAKQTPTNQNSVAYATNYQIYKELYSNLKGSFTKLIGSEY